MKIAIIFANTVFISFLCFADNYNVNLMWIRDANSPQEYFCSTKDVITHDQYEAKCIMPIAEWVKKSSPSTHVRVWYDAMHTEERLVQQARADVEAKLALSREKD